MLAGMFASRVSGGPPATYLDSLSPTPLVVHSLRKMISTATQCVRVRNTTSGVESDIGFSGDGVDTAALATAGGANSLTIRTWYDQTGNGFHKQQTTAANQPLIYSAGVYLGHVAYDGSDDTMTISSLTAGTSYFHIYTKSRIPLQAGIGVMYETSTNYNGTNGAFLIYMDSNALGVGIHQGVNWRRDFGSGVQTGLNLNVIQMQTAVADGTLAQQIYRLNGANQVAVGSVGTPATPATTFATLDMHIASRAGSSFFYAIEEETMVCYDADTTSIQTAIEAIVA